MRLHLTVLFRVERTKFPIIGDNTVVKCRCMCEVVQMAQSSNAHIAHRALLVEFLCLIVKICVTIYLLALKEKQRLCLTLSLSLFTQYVGQETLGGRGTISSPRVGRSRPATTTTITGIAVG